MLFACLCWDKPGSGNIRKQMSPDHLLYLGAKSHVVRLCGQLLADSGDTEGNLLILDVEIESIARAFMVDDISSRNSLFEAVEIRRFRQLIPEAQVGDLALAGKAAQLWLRQDGRTADLL